MKFICLSFHNNAYFFLFFDYSFWKSIAKFYVNLNVVGLISSGSFQAIQMSTKEIVLESVVDKYSKFHKMPYNSII